jgi:hypothetical protein
VKIAAVRDEKCGPSRYGEKRPSLKFFSRFSDISLLNAYSLDHTEKLVACS